MWQAVLRPISQRLATAVGAALTALGMAQADVNIVAAAIPIVLGFGADLIIRRIY